MRAKLGQVEKGEDVDGAINSDDVDEQIKRKENKKKKKPKTTKSVAFHGKLRMGLC